MVALLGGALAASTHFSKSGTRVLANASPEPFSNWALSIAEDLFVVGLGVLALKYPAAAAIVVIVCLALIVGVRRCGLRGRCGADFASRRRDGRLALTSRASIPRRERERVGRERLVVDVAEDAFQQIDLDGAEAIQRRGRPDLEARGCLRCSGR